MAVYSEIDQVRTKERVLVYDIDAVFQSIVNILSTPMGTRFFLPEFGSALEDFLFEPLDDVTGLAILTEVTGAINRWDPRVLVDYGKSHVDPDYDNNRFNVTLLFRIDGLEQKNFEFKGVVTR